MKREKNENTAEELPQSNSTSEAETIVSIKKTSLLSQ